MEEYIETFLYILLTIVFLVVGSLGKRKRLNQKKTSTTTVDSEPANYKEPKNIFDYFQDQFGEETPEPEEINDQNQPAIEKEPVAEQEDRQEMIENVEQQILLEKEMKNDLQKYNVDFDLRKAVIYSEILNRKYY